MQALDESIVQQEHDGCEIPGNFRVPEEHLPNVADVLSFRMAQTELPDNERRVENEGCLDDRQDETGNQTEDRV